MRLAVICLFDLVAGDRDRQRRWRDYQASINNFKIVFRIICIITCIYTKTLFSKAHRIRIYIRTLSLCCCSRSQRNAHTVRCSSCPIHCIGNLVFNRVSTHGLFCTVVSQSVCITSNLHLKLRLPYGIEVIVRICLISGNLCRLLSASGITVILSIAIPQEIRFCRIISMRRFGSTIVEFIPTKEDISFARIWCRNSYSFINLQRRIRLLAIAVLTNEILSIAVAEPPDKGGRLFLCINIFRDDTNGIGSCLYLGMCTVWRSRVSRRLLCFRHIINVSVVVRIDPLSYDDL